MSGIRCSLTNLTSAEHEMICNNWIFCVVHTHYSYSIVFENKLKLIINKWITKAHNAERIRAHRFCWFMNIVFCCFIFTLLVIVTPNVSSEPKRKKYAEPTENFAGKTILKAYLHFHKASILVQSKFKMCHGMKKKKGKKFNESSQKKFKYNCGGCLMMIWETMVRLLFGTSSSRCLQISLFHLK